MVYVLLSIILVLDSFKGRQISSHGLMAIHTVKQSPVLTTAHIIYCFKKKYMYMIFSKQWITPNSHQIYNGELMGNMMPCAWGCGVATFRTVNIWGEVWTFTWGPHLHVSCNCSVMLGPSLALTPAKKGALVDILGSFLGNPADFLDAGSP